MHALRKYLNCAKVYIVYRWFLTAQTHVGSAVLPAVSAAPDQLEDGPVGQLDVLGVRAEHALTHAGRAQTAAQRQRPHPAASPGGQRRKPH